MHLNTITVFDINVINVKFPPSPSVDKNIFPLEDFPNVTFLTETQKRQPPHTDRSYSQSGQLCVCVCLNTSCSHFLHTFLIYLQ